MAAELWIDDGNPWYLSPDIWVVPGDDPDAAPGIPLASAPAYVWARVHNRGTTPITNGLVKYYWADPSASINRSNANLIGSSSVNLLAGETKDVLCVSQWIPQFVNNGHECLIAEIISSADPITPSPGPADPFDPPNHKQIAQRNISVTNVAPMMKMMVHSFVISNAPHFHTEKVVVKARQVSLEVLKPLAQKLGLKKLPGEAQKFTHFGLQKYKCGDPAVNDLKPEISFALQPGKQEGLALVVPIPKENQPGTAALFVIEQFAGDRMVGGLSVLVHFDSKEGKH